MAVNNFIDPTQLNFNKKFQNIFYFLFFIYYLLFPACLGKEVVKVKEKRKTAEEFVYVKTKDEAIKQIQDKYFGKNVQIHVTMFFKGGIMVTFSYDDF